MERTLIGDLSKHVGETVSISAWVDVARNQGKMAFFDFRDRSGLVQGVVFGKPEVLEVAQTLKQEWVVRVEGKVNERPEKMRRDVQNGTIELEITAIEVLSKAESMPFALDAELNIDTHFDNLPLTLRVQRTRDIFSVQATIVDTFRNSLKAEGFTEFQAPVLVGGDAEGGAAVFKIEDYYGKQAYLATSGQLYKQIMVGPFERSMTVAKTFRAEKSATTRHLSELTQLEFEMGFVESHKDVMTMLEKVIRNIATAVAEKHGEELKRFKVEPAMLPKDAFPVFTLLEAQEIIEKEFGGKAVGELDLEPEHEKQICKYAKEKFGSDFVFITHFPTKKRAFYTYPDPENPELSRSFDLLFRGLEINSGSQRIHNYEELVEKMKARKMDPEKFGFYLQAFKYGMPPHGGCSTGLERITMKMLDLGNVKEASAFPRDMNRIDTLLSTDKKED
ncbi:MAG TPA: aspartate--tRNA(Asn) ligase [Candidatus Paceibacterota bacterium]|nr:aspartate--tRNA(Asn) ligase [Candidatus Paceibacterota bacterium]